jgi:hypothetical protein
MFVTRVVEMVVDDVLANIVYLVGDAPRQELLYHFADLGMGKGMEGSGGR